MLLRRRFSLLLRPWLRSRTLLRSRLSLLLWPWLSSRTRLRRRSSLLLRPWLRGRTLLRRRLSLLLWLCLWPWLRSRTLLRCRFSLLLWLRSRTLLRCGFSLLLWLRSRMLLLRGPSLLLWLRSRTRLRCRFSLLLWLRSRTLLRSWSRARSRTSRNHWSDRFACRDGLRCCNYGWTPVIDGGKLLAVLCCRPLLLHLSGHRRNTLLTRCGDFRRQRPTSDASRPVVADTINCSVVDGDVVDHRVGYGAVIHVNIPDVHIVDGPVIVETISVPVAALITDADVTESIVNAAVVADMSAPKAVVVAIPAADEPPISRRPQEADDRRLRPDARHPVVTLGSIAPISWGPDIAFARAFRLRILRERWRGLLGLKHRLAVVCVLIAGVVLGIVLVLRGSRLLIALIRRRRLLCGLVRRLLIGLLRRLTGWRLLIGTRRLGGVCGGKVGRSCGILRLIGLCRLILGTGLLGVVFLTSGDPKRQCDGCGC